MKQNLKNLLGKRVGRRKRIHLTEEQLHCLKSISEIILAIISAGGLLAVSAVAPNLLSAVGKIYKLKKNITLSKSEQIEKTARIFYYLKKTGQIKFKKTGEAWKVSLTNLGRKRLTNLDFETLSLPKGKKWSHGYWEVAADIPTEDYRAAADAFRRKLKEMGFYPLQRTLWFYPFDPRRELQFLVDYYHISRFVTVMEVKRMDKQDDKVMKKYFKSHHIIA